MTQNQRSERPVAAPAKSFGELDSSKNEPAEKLERVEIVNTAEKTTRQKPKKASRFQPVGLIPVTVRLKPEIAGALKRASLERELEGEEMFTQQDLVESALEPWLREQGYIG